MLLLELFMSPTWSHPIWDAYQSQGNLNCLREDVLTTPWYRLPATVDDSLLVRAVECCDVGAAKVLMELGETPSLPTDDGFTIIHTAVDVAHEKKESQDSLQLIESLLEFGADPNVQGADGTPLHRAVGWGLTDVAELLLRHGANIEVRTLIDGELTPLMYAAMMGQPESVRCLLKHGADTRARCAAYCDNLTVEELVENQNAESAELILAILRG